MATYIQPEDLAGFLRSRKSTNCKIAADWVEEHPESQSVQMCCDWLESNLGQLSAGVYFGATHSVARVGIMKILAVSIVKPPVFGDKEMDRIVTEIEAMDGVARDLARKLLLISHDAVSRAFSRRAPSWASHLTRMLKTACCLSANSPDEYTVEFLVRKVVKVRADDDLAAERAAVKRLSPKDRKAAHSILIRDHTGTSVTGKEEFWSPNKKEWENE